MLANSHLQLVGLFPLWEVHQADDTIPIPVDHCAFVSIAFAICTMSFLLFLPLCPSLHFSRFATIFATISENFVAKVFKNIEDS